MCGIQDRMNMQTDLTQKQRQVLKFIFSRIRETHLPPTIREIARHFGFSSTGTVRDYLAALVKKGYIKTAPGKSRAIELVRKTFSCFPILGRVHAGSPVLAVEDIEGYLNLEELLFSDQTVFALRVKGQSMMEAGIFPDDLVLVKRQNMAQTGETIVALIGEETTIKILKKKGKDYILEPANPAYQSIPVDSQVEIVGKVIHVIRKLS